jgi:transcriptional regulator with XRE-family HTH domain
MQIIPHETFGTLILHYREEKNLPLRKVAAVLDTDTSTLSKMEKNLRNPNREHIEKLAVLFGLNTEELLLAFLSDHVAYQLAQKPISEQVLRVAEEKIKYICSKNAVQGILGF